MPATLSVCTPTLVQRANAALNGCRCPRCGGKLYLATITEYASLGRTIPLALVNLCERCEAEYVTEAEWRRWAREVGP